MIHGFSEMLSKKKQKQKKQTKNGQWFENNIHVPFPLRSFPVVLGL